jgi:hypothetical protein
LSVLSVLQQLISALQKTPKATPAFKIDARHPYPGFIFEVAQLFFYSANYAEAHPARKSK